MEMMQASSCKTWRKSLLLLSLHCLLTSYSISAQRHVFPVSEGACAQCCTNINFGPTNEVEQSGCQQTGCRGSQPDPNQAQTPCATIFGGFGSGRFGCEIARDFRFKGLSRYLGNENPLLQCVEDGTITLIEPFIGPPILTSAECSTCCTQLDNGFDSVGPDDFAVEACTASCSSQLLCENDFLNRKRLGCAIGISFVTEGRVFLRETNRLFTCDLDGLTQVPDSATNAPTTSITISPTRFPTNVPTRFPTGLPTGFPTKAPTKSIFIPTVFPTSGVSQAVEFSDDIIILLGVSLSVTLLLLGIILGFVCRQKKQSVIFLKSDGGNVFGSAISPEGSKVSGQNLQFYNTETTARNYPAPLYYSYDGTVSSLNSAPAPDSANFSNTDDSSNLNGNRAGAISVATLIADIPTPPPRTPIRPLGAPVPPLKIGRNAEASF